ncbi:MAG: ankyrin repeat domain-containing protein [Betaproteobacteria bacterium]|nr:ankyrin repeat domain-containing protein [Betaproteobacteria bacterium]
MDSRLRGSLVALVAFLLQGDALAQWGKAPAGPATRIEAVDASGTPIEGVAFYVMEHFWYPRGHSGGYSSACALHGTGFSKGTLPGRTIALERAHDPVGRTPFSDTFRAGLAFKPGYCATPRGGNSWYLTMLGPAPVATTSRDHKAEQGELARGIRAALVPSRDKGAYRLRYLQRVVQEAACGLGDDAFRVNGEINAVAKLALAEAEGLAKSPYERRLLVRIREQLRLPESAAVFENPMIAAAAQNDVVALKAMLAAPTQYREELWVGATKPYRTVSISRTSDGKETRSEGHTGRVIDSGPVSLDGPGESGATPLVVATLAGAADAVDFLLAAGANPNFRVQPWDESPFEALVTKMVSTWDDRVDDALLARYKRIYASYLDGAAKPDITPRFREQLGRKTLKSYGPRLQPVWDAVLPKIAALPEAKPSSPDCGAGV